MIDFISDFIWTWYLSPGYNIVNTITYGIVLGLVVFRIIPRLEPLLGDVNRGFWIAVAPYIFYGATMRELVDRDIGIYAGNTEYPANYMLVSPGIYFTMFCIALFCILLGKAVQRGFGIDWRIGTGFMGCALCAYNIALILSGPVSWKSLGIVGVFFLMSSVLLYALKKAFRINYLDFEGNMWIVLVHFFDAATTFVGIDFMGHVEKHVVPNFFIGLLGTAAVMFPLKLAVLLPALYMIDDELSDEDFARRFVKFVIVVLGAGPGIRNMTLMFMT